MTRRWVRRRGFAYVREQLRLAGLVWRRGGARPQASEVCVHGRQGRGREQPIHDTIQHPWGERALERSVIGPGC